MDAQIHNIESLSALSSSLLNSQETIAADCSSIANMMDEKLADLIRLRDEAEELAENINAEYQEALDDYADQVSSTQDVSDMQSNLHKLERRSREASYIMNDIRNAVEVCRAAVSTIAEETRTFKNESNRTVSEGRRFLTKAANDLRTYLEYKNNR